MEAHWPQYEKCDNLACCAMKQRCPKSLFVSGRAVKTTKQQKSSAVIGFVVWEAISLNLLPELSQSKSAEWFTCNMKRGRHSLRKHEFAINMRENCLKYASPPIKLYSKESQTYVLGGNMQPQANAPITMNNKNVSGKLQELFEKCSSW